MSNSSETGTGWKAPPIGAPCWVEIPAEDVKACKTFYSQLFPSWSFRPSTEQHMEDKIARWSFPGNPNWGGGIVQMRPGYKTSGQKNLTGPIIYHFVDSIEEKRVEQLGGTTLSGKEEEGSSGWYMYFNDVAGNRFGVYALRE